jgi:ABC-type multidrug transport system permease subunit
MDKTRSSGEFIYKLDSLKDINVIISDSVKSRDLVIKGKYACALIIKKGFQVALEEGNPTPVELVYDRSREMEIGIVQQSLISTLMSSTSEVIVRKSIQKFLFTQFPAIDRATWDNILKTSIKKDNNILSIKRTSVVGIKNDTKLGLVQAVAGTTILMLLFSIAGIGTSILEEKENGTINRLLYSPLKGSMVLYGKMLFALFISVIQLTTMFFFAWLIFNMDLSVNIPGLILMIFATAFAVSGLGIFLAAVAKTRQQAQNLSTIIILIMSAIGGSMIPVFIMPSILQKIAVISVNYWSIQGFYDLFWRVLPLVEILPRILILAGIGIVLTVVSIRLFRRRIMNW